MNIKNFKQEFKIIGESAIGLPMTESNRDIFHFRIQELLTKYDVSDIQFNLVFTDDNIDVQPVRNIDKLAFWALLNN